jgi:hypothetical protein
MLVLCLLAACTRPPPDATPEGAVGEWLGHMASSGDDPKEAKLAYDLMGPSAHANLEERAARAGQVQGQRVEPHDMLAAGHFGLKFRPRKMTSTIDGASAVVHVAGGDATESADVHCVREGQLWRIEPELPEPQVLPKRDGG